MPDYSRLFSREHPFFTAHKGQWIRNHRAYSGGKSYINVALVPHLSEIPDEFKERLKRAYYFNWPRKIARIITQYVLATRPERKGADPDLVEDWDRSGLRTDEIMRQFSTYLNIFGTAWLAVDMPSFDGIKTKADEISEKLRPYVVALNPLQVIDWCYGADGILDWVLVKEFVLDNSDPYDTPVEIDIRKLWTRNDVTVVAHYSSGKTEEKVIRHNLGLVPFIRKVEVDGFGLEANHWFDDVVNIVWFKFMQDRNCNSPVTQCPEESNDPIGPYGAKGVGEPTLIPTAPAIANAIEDACGVRIRDLPITPEKLYWALHPQTDKADA